MTRILQKFHQILLFFYDEDGVAYLTFYFYEFEFVQDGDIKYYYRTFVSNNEVFNIFKEILMEYHIIISGKNCVCAKIEPCEEKQKICLFWGSSEIEVKIMNNIAFSGIRKM